jgi:hypothetical protein
MKNNVKNNLNMVDSIATENGMCTVNVPMKGSIRLVTRKGSHTGEIVDDITTHNNILTAIRIPIITLLGGYLNIQTLYCMNGSSNWVSAADSVSVNSVNGTFQYMVNYNSNLPVVQQIAFGSDPTPATEFDTGLIAPISGASKLLACPPVFTSGGLQAQFSVLFGENELNDTPICEAVLLTPTGTAIARAAIGSYTKVAGMFFEFFWTIGFDPITAGS